MRVLFASSEVYPLIKTGGLADVSGALPKAIQQLADFDGSIKIVIPGYPAVLAKLPDAQPIANVTALNQPCTLLSSHFPDSSIEVIVVQNASLYERDGGPYNDAQGIDWPDNVMRFGVFSKIVSLLTSTASPLRDWIPDLLHCNDWQTGLAPAYMKLLDRSGCKSIMSIHNLAFQGNFDARYLEALALPRSHFHIHGFEYYGQVSFLKAGIFYADQLSTVSPTYAQEIQSEPFGFGMQGLLRSRSRDLTGILNGIDTDDWNPETDAYLPSHYSAKKLAGKKEIKRLLQQQLGLSADESAPLLGVVSRLTHQKGLDLLPDLVPELLNQGCQLVVLGAGDKALESQFVALGDQYPGKVSINIGYHEYLSHNIMAGCDIFIMPSRFEPCGLNQLYGLAYGTPPVVSPTGGLFDSICDTNPATLKDGRATGFVMENVTSTSLLVTIQRALETWKNPKVWQQLQQNGMKRDISWASSAKAYFKLYKKTLGERH